MFRTMFMTAAILAAIAAETQAITIGETQAAALGNEWAQVGKGFRK